MFCFCATGMKIMEAIVASVRQVLQDAGLEAGAGLVVAASGGVDSTVLLDVLDGLGYQLHVAHLDHALRPDSADDSRFVADEAKRRGLPCSVERRDVGAYARTEGLSLEEAGRRQRYIFLDQVADRTGSQFIALGHHADDQAETVILRLLRGSGATGLRGMEIVREGRYLRPLLRVRRAEIEEYARQRGLCYREDPSNRDWRFLRNRVRGELLPLLKSYNSNITEVLNRTAALLKAEDDLLAALAQEALDTVICERCNDKVALDSNRLLTYHIAIQRRVLRAVLQGLAAAEGPFDFARIEQVRDWIEADDKRLRVLGAGLKGQGCGTRYILRRGQRPPVACCFEIPGVLVLREHGVKICVQIVSPEHFDKSQLGGARVALDADRLGAQVQVRSLRPGDRFQPLGMEGHKKLSDFLIDAKWPKISRDEVLVLARGEEIAWVAPLRSSHAFRIQSTTRRIALCTLRHWDGD
ncbi:MAG: tRNA lysidine(34) synthetase TilS [Gemmatimonadetes bacterium]|nr:tRNA lysidine(34) synthetase TilS [Gemmatimonadota bacterium]MYC69122.1 tRNA lysidine(34) synthetase TilS [Gemmatimonadota bacterium]